MNFWPRKKKQEDQPAAQHPATTSISTSASASAPASSSSSSSSSSAAPHRAIRRGSSVNGITIPPRTNSTTAATGQSQQANSPRNNSSPNDQQQQQQQLQQQQQQQQFYQQQQLQYQQQQQLQQQQQHHDTDPVAPNPSSLPQQQQQQQQVPPQQQQQQQQMQQPMQMQAMPQQSYGSDAMLSQTIQYPSYQDQSMHPGNVPGMDSNYEGGYAGGASDDHLLQHNNINNESNVQVDGYYSQTNTGYENSSNNGGSGGAPTSGPIQLPGQLAAQGTGNGSLNGAPNGMDSNNNSNNSIGGNLGNGSGELSTDARKLQDEIQSWKKSQESAQTKVNQLRTTLTQKSQENRELHQSLLQVTQDRLTLQELVHKREKEMDDLRSKYLNDVRQIRATDDDHATIEQRVRMLQAAILQLTKSSSGDRAVNLNMEEAQHLVKKKYKFGNSQPYILNMFLEKYIMDTLLEEVFHCPFYVGFALAKEYNEIHKWMIDNNFGDQAVRFRQQLCFMSAKAPVAQAHAAQEATRIAKSFEVKLERLYNNWTGHQKVLDLVTKAIELSLTMKSQNAEISAQVIAGETEFDAEKMVPAHKSKEGGKVKVCVMPCFVDTNGVVLGKAKVFCG